MDREYQGAACSSKRRCRFTVESAMGTAFTSVFIREFDTLGPRPSAWHFGMGRLPLYGLAHPQRRMASRAALGMDGGLLPLAIDSIQPDHALPVADLSTARD